MHYFQFNISDYKSHTEHLELFEDLAYRRMLDWCYLHEKPLPKNKDEIARIIRMRTHSESIAVVLQEFFTKTDNGEWIHKRVFLEIEKANAKSTKARKSAKARWDKVSSNANALRPDSESNATQDTPPNTHNPKDLVEKKILDILILKSGKKFKPVESNLKFIRARLKEGHTEKDITDVIDRKIAEWKDDPTMKQYIRPATLFNAEKFNQYIAEVDQPLPENKKTKQPWEKVPREDDKLVNWAKEHGYSRPGSIASYDQYRSKLSIEVEIRQKQERDNGKSVRH